MSEPLPHTFIQWKGTDLCMDLYCKCGGGAHIDGFFQYRVQCEDCGQCYELGTSVTLTPVADLNWEDALNPDERP